ncbi:hypothetical protein GC096_15670 [Paenibacillus sp. LMG 31461]|uniref:Uncharacterized protein n=1 Tax=Paenibacillus plantarum TaxID=2654975 RepID=A0ABX1XAJ5_9BACL|nr:hypothetical protein [Paenibacillus plantarum]NOU65473.1 hypothetical protein [Paenibacillus plantarum]
MSDNRYYPTIILGATFAGLGAAYACGKEALLIERSALVGYEFINSYNLGEDWHATVLSEEGEKLKNELLERGILSEDGRVHIPAIAPVLYNKIGCDSLPILLHSDIADIRQLGAGYEVTIYNASGFNSYRTDRIIDTRPEYAPSHLIKSKSLNAMLNCGEDDPEVSTTAGSYLLLTKGKLKGEVVAKVPIEVEDDWITARHKLHQLWAGRPKEWESWTISSVAGFFELQIEPETGGEIAPSWFSLPSAAYRNPLEAFEAGLLVKRRY